MPPTSEAGRLTQSRRHSITSEKIKRYFNILSKLFFFSCFAICFFRSSICVFRSPIGVFIRRLIFFIFGNVHHFFLLIILTILLFHNLHLISNFLISRIETVTKFLTVNTPVLVNVQDVRVPLLHSLFNDTLLIHHKLLHLREFGDNLCQVLPTLESANKQATILILSPGLSKVLRR